MPDIWGLLPKSAIDNETIEEAIARLIAEHEEDPESHLSAGGSLNSHKASEVIDHIARSIVLDKLGEGSVDFTKFTLENIFYITGFDSVDGWAKDGDSGSTFTAGILYARLFSGSTINYECWAEIESIGLGDMSKLNYFQTNLKFITSANHFSNFYVGAAERFGFKVVSGVLYAYHRKSGTDYPTEVPDITLTEYNTYRGILDPDIGEIRFYVNNVLVATHTTNLPTGVSATPFLYYIQTTDGNGKTMYIRDLLYMTKR